MSFKKKYQTSDKYVLYHENIPNEYKDFLSINDIFAFMTDNFHH